MKNKTFKIFCLLMLSATIITSCKKEVQLSPSTISNKNLQQNEDMIILGEQLEDPYSIINMKKAYASLRKSGDVPEIDITPTHKYLRFLPKNEIEWGLLKSDTTIHLYDYPLNFEVKNIGTYYHDASLPDSTITWQYCVLPIDYVLPIIHYEEIYDVFIPEENETKKLKNGNDINDFYIKLEAESVKLTGNLPDNTERIEKASKWTPKGKIRVWDNHLG